MDNSSLSQFNDGMIGHASKEIAKVESFAIIAYVNSNYEKPYGPPMYEKYLESQVANILVDLGKLYTHMEVLKVLNIPGNEGNELYYKKLMIEYYKFRYELITLFPENSTYKDVDADLTDLEILYNLPASQKIAFLESSDIKHEIDHQLVKLVQEKVIEYVKINEYIKKILTDNNEPIKFKEKMYMYLVFDGKVDPYASYEEYEAAAIKTITLS